MMAKHCAAVSIPAGECSSSTVSHSNPVVLMSLRDDGIGQREPRADAWVATNQAGANRIGFHGGGKRRDHECRGTRRLAECQTSGLATQRGLRPSRQSSTACAAASLTSAPLSYPSDAWWGVMSRLGTEWSGWSAGSGSTVKTSSAAPAIQFSRSARASAASSMIAPRAVLIRHAPGFILRNCVSPISPRVSGVSAACSETKSDSAEQPVERDKLDAEPRSLRRWGGIESEQAHAKTGGAAGHGLADAAAADEADRFTSEVRAPRRIPDALAQAEPSLRNAPRHRQQQPHSVIRHRFGKHPRSEGHHDAVPRGGREIDRIRPDSPSRDQLELPRLRRAEHRRVEMIHARKHGIDIHKLRKQLRLGQRTILQRVNKLAAGLPQPLKRPAAHHLDTQRPRGNQNSPRHPVECRNRRCPGKHEADSNRGKVVIARELARPAHRENNGRAKRRDAGLNASTIFLPSILRVRICTLTPIDH